MSNQLTFLSITQLSDLIRKRELSPVEVVETFLDRLETLGPRYNAVVTVTRKQALKQAKLAEQDITRGNYKGKLHGIPYGAKDLLATSDDIPTTWGASPLRNQVFDYDATVIRKLEAAGAILAAKLAMVELAGGMGYRHANASFTGPGISPWGTENSWTGGSSSGSGASVAAGLVPFAIGSETWGSILSPANNCGVAGLRPSYGRVSRHGAMALSWSLDKLGPLCLTADDCGLVLGAIAGYDPNDLSTSKKKYRYDAKNDPDRRFKIGVIRDIADGCQAEVQSNFKESLRVLEKVATIDEVDLPEIPYEAVVRTILFAESASALEEFIESGKTAELTAVEDRYGGYAPSVVLATDYLKALRIRGVIAKTIDQLLSGYDALVAPSRPSVAPPAEGEFRSFVRTGAKDPMGAIGNVAGLPAISVPNGFGEGGLPTGVQFMGRVYEENTVLAIARTYQSLTEWHQQHPAGLVPST